MENNYQEEWQHQFALYNIPGIYLATDEKVKSSLAKRALNFKGGVATLNLIVLCRFQLFDLFWC